MSKSTVKVLIRVYGKEFQNGCTRAFISSMEMSLGMIGVKVHLSKTEDGIFIRAENEADRLIAKHEITKHKFKVAKTEA